MKVKTKKKEYTVKFKREGKTTSNVFNNITKAREFAHQTYRDGSYVSFHNINSIPLCI